MKLNRSVREISRTKSFRTESFEFLVLRKSYRKFLVLRVLEFLFVFRSHPLRVGSQLGSSVFIEFYKNLHPEMCGMPCPLLQRAGLPHTSRIWYQGWSRCRPCPPRSHSTARTPARCTSRSCSARRLSWVPRGFVGGTEFPKVPVGPEHPQTCNMSHV